MFSSAATSVVRRQCHRWRVLQRLACGAATPVRRGSSHIQPDNIVKSPFPDIAAPDANVSLPDFLFSGQRRNYTAIEDAVTRRSFTLDQLENHCATFGAGLVQHLGMERGDIVAVMCPNRPEYAVAFLGTMMAGGIVTTANTIYTSHELNKQLTTAGAKYVFTTAELLSSVVEAAIANTDIKGVVVMDTDSSRPSSLSSSVRVVPLSLLLQTSAGLLPRFTVDAAKDTAVIPFSSGTTGLPKGVMLSHRNLIVNVLQMADEPELMYFRQSEDECVLCVMPFYHIYGMVVLLANGIYQRCRLLTVPKFDPNIMPGIIGQEKVTQLFVAPPLILFLLNDPRGQAADLSSVHYAFSAAAPLGRGVQEELSNRLQGKPVLQGYGLTELSPICHASPRSSYKLGSIGLPVPSTEVKICSLDGEKRSLSAHENGEVCVRGPQVFQGYLNRPEATAEMLDSDGWLHTGDIGHYDEDGHFFIVDRLKELIKVKGYQVAPAELEAELLHHPDIADAAAIGVPHERFGEAPRAFVVRRPGSDITEETVAEFISSRLASYKHLVGGVEFMDQLPKSPAGKLLRHVLRKR
ncbi:uncharacterized protein LOC135823207 [Sycon ciliatum]|uniref:uncharacterized protein LOC135823207 n=1 Tax=Sycon ciliatum TaxID=27933 RepID=UPI0031F610DB|eukprot:scpid78866/ scgid21615/ Probable 4-coumarate--CoA ligase 3; 4-coumaroyl-CoA synthase 3